MNNLVFLEEPHIYLLDGIKIPCVSEIIEFRFPELYKNIPSYILKNKADYGTKLHIYSESFLQGEISLKDIDLMRIDPNIKVSIKQLAKLKDKYQIEAKEIENHVHYKDKYAGTFDILTKSDYIIDIKTTSVLHIDSNNDKALNEGKELNYDAPLNLQISLYYLANGIEKDCGYCLWLPKNKIAEFIQVKCWPKEKLLELLENYEQKNKSTSDR